jgi:zinc transporter ZupT
MVLTAIGAGVGYWLGGSVDHGIVILIEGLAAGAMLTMIAAAMIPEAVHLGGSSVTGLSTLSGSLGAIAFKLLE